MNLDHLFGSLFDGAPTTLADILSDSPTTAGDADALLHEGIASMRELMDGFAGLLNQRLPQDVQLSTDIPYRRIDGQQLTLDVMAPVQPGPHPVLVYLHGGAWVWGSPASHRKLTCRLAQQGFLTLSIDYRLAPEHPFPAALTDCIHAVHFAAANVHQWQGDNSRMTLAGDSAGANLAAATAIELARATGSPEIAALALFYGVFDFDGFDEEGITRLLMDAYLGERANELCLDPRVSPVRGAKLLPPTHLAVGTADPLTEDAQALYGALQKAGTASEICLYEDMPHAFAQMEIFSEAREALQKAARFLHQHAGS